MDESQIRLDDGAAYEDFMGKWSQLAGDIFLNWLAPPARLRSVDVGCGNGAFTEMLVQRCSPGGCARHRSLGAQGAFARTRLLTSSAEFRPGSEMARPYADGVFDAAVMALAIFFVPDPVKGASDEWRRGCSKDSEAQQQCQPEAVCCGSIMPTDKV